MTDTVTSSDDVAEKAFPAEAPAEPCKPRICMPTWRGFKKMAFECGLYEAQDVLLDIDDVDLIRLEPDRGFQLRQKWQRKLLWRDVTKKLAFINPGLRPVSLKTDYDLFVAVCQNWWDLMYVNAIKGWKENCKTSVCYIDEVWAGVIPKYKYWLHALARFDHVLVGLSGSASALGRAIGRECHWVPGAVDALRFNPYPKPPARVIDVYGIGRRYEGIHRALLKLAARNEIFYVHDTAADAGDTTTLDHRQHRDLIGNMAKRSRCFMVAPAKLGNPEETYGQFEVGYRYFEGSAAGAVLIGQAPDCGSFRKLFDWPDAVIGIQTDGSDVADVLSGLAAHPERVREISRRNMVEGLLRHDWSYRWKQILGIAGLKPAPAMEARCRRLRQLASLVESGA